MRVCVVSPVMPGASGFMGQLGTLVAVSVARPEQDGGPLPDAQMFRT